MGSLPACSGVVRGGALQQMLEWRLQSGMDPAAALTLARAHDNHTGSAVGKVLRFMMRQDPQSVLPQLYSYYREHPINTTERSTL